MAVLRSASEAFGGGRPDHLRPGLARGGHGAGAQGWGAPARDCPTAQKAPRRVTSDRSSSKASPHKSRPRGRSRFHTRGASQPNAKRSTSRLAALGTSLPLFGRGSFGSTGGMPSHECAQGFRQSGLHGAHQMRWLASKRCDDPARMKPIQPLRQGTCRSRTATRPGCAFALCLAKRMQALPRRGAHRPRDDSRPALRAPISILRPWPPRK
jgi:hypothetical protein